VVGIQNVNAIIRVNGNNIDNILKIYKDVNLSLYNKDDYP